MRYPPIASAASDPQTKDDQSSARPQLASNPLTAAIFCRGSAFRRFLCFLSPKSYPVSNARLGLIPSPVFRHIPVAICRSAIGSCLQGRAEEEPLTQRRKIDSAPRGNFREQAGGGHPGQRVQL